MAINIFEISSKYEVKIMQDDDVYDIYNLCNGNTKFYKYSKDELSIEFIKQDLKALPPGKTEDDKFYIGFYKENKLLAIMSLIIGFPDKDTAYIAFFMMDNEFHRSGIGSEIINEVLAFIKKEKFKYVKLGCIKDNLEGKRFWEKNKFLPTGGETETDNYIIISMQRDLTDISA